MRSHSLVTTLSAVLIAFCFASAPALSQRVELHRNADRVVVGASLRGTKEARQAVRPEAVAGLARIKTLQYVSFIDTTVDDASLTPLRTLDQLVSLQLRDTNVSGDALNTLSSFPSLASLNLIGCDISDRQLVFLEDFANLRVLHLAKTKVTDSGMAFIARVRSLIVLNLSDCKLTDDAVKEIAKLSHIEYLWISRTLIGDKSVDRISGISSLRDLGVVECEFTDAGLGCLRKNMPQTTIRSDPDQRFTYSLKRVMEKKINEDEQEDP